MKIITKDAAYVQKHDLRQLLDIENYPIPASILNKTFGSKFIIIDQRNQFEFQKFDKSEEIEFFQNQDWIIDYNQVKDYTEEELLEYGQTIAEERNTIAKAYNNSNDFEKKKSLNQRIELLEFKMYELRDVLLFRKGKIKMKLPEGIEVNKIKRKNPIKQYFNKWKKKNEK